MGLFGKSKPKGGYLGIDIGSSGIKVVELSNIKGRPTVMTYGYSEREGAKDAPLIADPKAAGALLAKICADAGTVSTQAMAALPAASIFSTIVTVPRKKNEKEMKPLVDAQIEKLAPLPLAEMITYSTFIDGEKDKKESKSKNKKEKGKTKPEPKKKQSDYVRVLVTGAAKTLVQKYIEIFKTAKLSLSAIDTEAFALIRSLVGKDKSAVMIIDMGATRTSVTVVERGVPFLSRSINVGGDTVSRRIAKQMGVADADAEQFKMDLATAPAGKSTLPGGLPEILKPIMEPIVNEIQYAFQLHSNMELSEFKKVEKIVITGGSSHLPRVPEYLSEVLNLNVYRGDPWARVAYPQALRDVLDEIGPKMSVAVGLAMREMD